MKYSLQVLLIFKLCSNSIMAQSHNYTNVKSQTSIFERSIKELTFEVTMTDNPSLDTKMDVLNWHYKCKGAIITPQMVLTTTTCARSNVSQMYMYCGYLSVNSSEGLLMLHLKDTRIVKKNKTSDENGIALIELAERLDLHNPHISLGELPDFLPINKEVPLQISCNVITTFITNRTAAVVNLQLLESDECNDIVQVLNVEIDINDKDYCIVLPATSPALHGIVPGSTCTWNGKIHGLVTEVAHNKDDSFRLISVINIGAHVNWIRSKMLRLRYKRSSAGILILKYNLYMILITHFIQ